MYYQNRILILAVLLGAITLVTGCGGGGGGGGGGGNSFPYEGNNSQAVITTTNAARLVAVALGDTTASSENTATRATTSAYSQKTDQMRLSSRLSRDLHDTLTQTFTARPAELRTATGVAIDDTEQCEDGSIHYTGTINDDETGIVTANYHDCRYGDETLSGQTVLRVVAYDLTFGIITDSTFSYSTLTQTTSTFSVSFSGSVRSQVTIGTNTERLTFNLVTRDNTTGDMTKAEDLVIVDVYDNFLFSSSFSETLTGRVFDSVHGFVDITTLVPLFFGTINQLFPDSGQLLVTGAGNASIRVTIQSLTLVWLDLDLDGDTTFDIIFALNWIDLFTEPDLQDSDNDGIHDDWEQVNGLNPLDPTDAIQDNDTDGFSNIVEYLADSDINDATSLPQIADLSISIVAPGKALVASTLSYLLEVNNLGPLNATNVTATFILPAEVSYLAASGSGWSCNHVNGTATCDRGSLPIGSTATFAITVSLPLSPGNIKSFASVSSSTLDAHMINNTSGRDVDLVALVPSLNLDLGKGAFAFDMELDDVQRKLYVSLPRTNSVAIISLDTLSVIDDIFVGSGPLGIALNPSKDTLYIALNYSGAVAALNLNTLSVTQIDVSAELNTIRASDVIAPLPNDVFVSGFASYLVKIDTGNNNLVGRIASNRSTSHQSVFAARANPQFMYSTGLFPDFVYKLDLGQDDAPLILENLHSGLSGNKQNHLTISPDGSKLFLSNGDVLSTSTLSILGQIGDGVSFVTGDGTAVLVGEVPNNIGVFDTTTYSKIDQIYSTCNIAEVRKIIEIEAGLEWVLMGENSICKLSAPDNVNPVSPVADLVVNTSVLGSTVVDSGIRYLVEVRNLGPITATNVTVTDTLPVGTSFFAANGSGWNCNHASGVVTCNRENLTAGAASELTISVSSPLNTGDITNFVEVSSDTPDDDQSNNTDSLVTFVGPKASSVNLDLGASTFDIEKDTARRQLYVSLPDLGSIAVVSLDTLSVTNSIFVGLSPHGITLDPTGDTLYVALNQGGAVAVLDLNSLVVSQIDVSAELNTNRAYDVIAPTPNNVFVSGNPVFPGTAYILKIDTAASNQVTRVASNATLNSDPIFKARSNPQFVYVYENDNPHSLYKLDISQPNAPLVLQKDTETGFLEDVSLDGSRLIFGTGKVVSTDTFSQMGRLTREFGRNALGVATVSTDGTSALFTDGIHIIEIYDMPTYLIKDRLITSCNIGPRIYKIVELQVGLEWALLGEDDICVVSNP